MFAFPLQLVPPFSLFFLLNQPCNQLTVRFNSDQLSPTRRLSLVQVLEVPIAFDSQLGILFISIRFPSTPTQSCNSPSYILATKAFEVLVDEISYRNRFENVFRSSSELRLQMLVSISCLIPWLASESVTVIDPIRAVYISSSSRKHTYMHTFAVSAIPELAKVIGVATVGVGEQN